MPGWLTLSRLPLPRLAFFPSRLTFTRLTLPWLALSRLAISSGLLAGLITGLLSRLPFSRLTFTGLLALLPLLSFSPRLACRLLRGRGLLSGLLRSRSFRSFLIHHFRRLLQTVQCIIHAVADFCGDDCVGVSMPLRGLLSQLRGAVQLTGRLLCRLSRLLQLSFIKLFARAVAGLSAFASCSGRFFCRSSQMLQSHLRDIQSFGQLCQRLRQGFRSLSHSLLGILLGRNLSGIILLKLLESIGHAIEVVPLLLQLLTAVLLGFCVEVISRLARFTGGIPHPFSRPRKLTRHGMSQGLIRALRRLFRMMLCTIVSCSVRLQCIGLLMSRICHLG